MVVGRMFSREANSGFLQVMTKIIFPMGANNGEISFYQLKTKRKRFSTKQLIEKCQNVKFHRPRPALHPFRHPWRSTIFVFDQSQFEWWKSFLKGFTSTEHDASAPVTTVSRGDVVKVFARGDKTGCKVRLEVKYMKLSIDQMWMILFRFRYCCANIVKSSSTASVGSGLVK